MSRNYKIGSPADKGDNKPPKILYIIVVTLGFYFLWSSLPKVEMGNEPPLMTDRELLEKISELTSFVGPDEHKISTAQRRLAVLGKKIFFDKRFSSNEQVSCATCHDPQHSFTDKRKLAIGVAEASRNTPPIINMAESSWFFWDGRADSLALQALGPLFHEKEMGLTPRSLAQKVSAYYKKEYETLFGRFPRNIVGSDGAENIQFVNSKSNQMSLEMGAYGLATVSSFTILDNILQTSAKMNKAPAILLNELSRERTLDHNLLSKNGEPSSNEDLEKIALNIGLTLEAFQLGLVAKKSPFDDFLSSIIATRDVPNSLSEKFGSRELDGLKIFLGQGNCALCHNGSNFTDQGFHNIGLPINSYVDEKELPTGRAQGVLDIVKSNFNCDSQKMEFIRSRFSGTENKNASCKELKYLDTENLELMGSFKTPTLRNISLTGPYMHDGRFETLEEVIEHYDTLNGRTAIGHREESLKPLNLSEERKRKLIAFLNALTSEIEDLTEK